MSDFEATLEQIISERVSVTGTPKQMEQIADYSVLLAKCMEDRAGTKQEYLRDKTFLENAITTIRNDISNEYQTAIEAARIDPVYINEATLICLEEDYPPQFVALQTAYNGAMILNDTVTMSAITVQYQNLLSEYNAEREAVL